LATVEADLSHRIDSVPERFVPAEARGELTEAEHLARYWWACRLAAGKRVLDAGCGTGYGANMLAAARAAEVVGVDIAEAVIEAAAANAPPNVTFRVADVHDLPFDDAAFDLITCFEVIEHVEGRDQVISELGRLLGPSGVLVMSSPNRDAYVPGNPHHVYEYIPEEFEQALRATFEYFELRHQHDWIGSAIFDRDDLSSEDLAPLQGIQVGKALAAEPRSAPFTIALAGHSELPRPGPALVLTGLAEVRKWLELWHEQQEVLTGQQEHFQQLKSHWTELQELRRELRQSEQQLAMLPELELTAARAAARERELAPQVEALSQQVDQLQRKANEVYNSVSWRITRPLRAVKRIVRGG
jgi:2-polyprenyl-3-methyl-5-hydroxy-6-metoxy-1,4-benzoquinol methylase